MNRKFAKPVPENIKRRTAYNQKRYRMSLADAFEEACGALASPGTELHDAWYRGDFYDYIPQEYRYIPDNHCAWMDPKAAHEWLVDHLRKCDFNPTRTLSRDCIERICGETVFRGLVAGGYIKYAGRYGESGAECYTIKM